MIKRLRKRFIAISISSILAVILLVFLLMLLFNVSMMNNNLDMLADNVSRGDGRFPDLFGEPTKPQINMRPSFGDINFITPETRFSTRHFSVWINADGEVEKINTEYIYSITEENAISYAKDAIDKSKTQGWISNYRYKLYDYNDGIKIVFIDGSTQIVALFQSLTIAGSVLLLCGSLVLILIILLSGKAVKPIAESYEKQRRFITDANHELKTPLTLILANTDIAESELGHNEWLDDIRSEGNRMTELVNQLVALSRMDEENPPIVFTSIALSDILQDAVDEFESLTRLRGMKLNYEIEPGISIEADEASIKRLISIIMDNAVKYCDDGGEISVSLYKKRNVILSVENSYSQIDKVELDKLFDRFYRADTARTYTGGYGVGLSIARAIAQNNKAEIHAYKKGKSYIGFKVNFK